MEAVQRVARGRSLGDPVQHVGRFGAVEIVLDVRGDAAVVHAAGLRVAREGRDRLGQLQFGLGQSVGIRAGAGCPASDNRPDRGRDRRRA